MKKNLGILGVSALVFALLLTSCSSSSNEATSIQNESIRASNCALIADWVIASDGPVVDYGNRNMFEIYTFKEEYIWSKMQIGDKSFDALLELRKLDYNQNYYTAPQLGETVTLENDSNYRNDGSLYDEDESWKIIENVRVSCPTFSKEYLADNFSSGLKFDSRYKK
jgi:hypothetical protein